MFRNLINRVLDRMGVPDDVKEKIAAKLEEKHHEELKNPPKIALIGKSGVGKSSTINSLFGTQLSVSHFKACTQESEEVKISTPKGDIIIYDMPGLGEDIDTDEKHKETYKQVLPTCDVVIWIMVANAAGRAMAFDQMMLRDVVKPYISKLVIGVNQIDLIEPGDWDERGNFPSEGQRANMVARLKDIQEKLCKVVPELQEEQVLYYSAKKHYRLDHLFATLLQNCGNDRAWVLDSRKNVADYRDLIHPDVLKIIGSNNKA